MSGGGVPTLVVGASGFLGRSVVDRLEDLGGETRGTYHGDPREGARIAFDFFEDDPADLPLDGAETVVFAAHVERTDHSRERFEAAVERFVAACRRAGVRLCYVSSAGVFDGDEGRYVESDDPTPTSRYGRRLRAFERRAARLPEWCVLRPGYLYGYSRGELDDRLSGTVRRLREGERVRYYGDAYRSPIEVGEAASAVARLARGDVRGVVHAPAPRTSVAAFHRAAASAMGLPYHLVEAEPMPADPSLHRDTSLDSERFERLVGFRPRSVAHAMRATGGSEPT